MTGLFHEGHTPKSARSPASVPITREKTWGSVFGGGVSGWGAGPGEAEDGGATQRRRQRPRGTSVLSRLPPWDRRPLGRPLRGPQLRPHQRFSAVRQAMTNFRKAHTHPGAGGGRACVVRLESSPRCGEGATGNRNGEPGKGVGEARARSSWAGRDQNSSPSSQRLAPATRPPGARPARRGGQDQQCLRPRKPVATRTADDGPRPLSLWAPGRQVAPRDLPRGWTPPAGCSGSVPGGLPPCGHGHRPETQPLNPLPTRRPAGPAYPERRPRHRASSAPWA